MKNSFGQNFKITVFGSSHTKYLGGVIEGCAKDIVVDYAALNKYIDRRRPNDYGTQRKESDKIHFLSGIENGNTLSTPIAFVFANSSIKREDYNDFALNFRPSHVDYPYYVKYDEDNLLLKDNSSARMFLPIVVAGYFAKEMLQSMGINVEAQVSKVGDIDINKNKDGANVLLNKALENGDTIGGQIICKVNGLKAGIGEAMFGKISSYLAMSIFSIPSCCAFHLGERENRKAYFGSEDLDEWNNDFTTKTNINGGMNGGISNGNDIVFLSDFHPVHTLGREMNLISDKGEIGKKKIATRNDISQIFRTDVVVESMTAITLIDKLKI